MEKTKITVQITVNAPASKVWDCYNTPEHITKWNFADPSWCCPYAENDMRVGGKYKARMEAKDGSFGFDFEAIYSEIYVGEHFTYELGDRTVNVKFLPVANQTSVIVTFDAEDVNSIEMQKAGWQAILNNFKTYTETKL